MFAHEQRGRVVALCVELSRRGYLAGTGGNVALRLDAERFVVTPSAIDYLAMRAEDICVVRLADLRQLDGAATPSVETGLHAQVLRRRPDVACSIHTHQPVASACALLGAALAVEDPALQAAIGTRVPMVGYFPSGTGLLAWLLARQLRPSSNAYLMRNHGVLCCGRSLEQAVAAVDALEQLACDHLARRIERRALHDAVLAAPLHAVLTALEA
ncbi:Methylthioribulose-1-phosphate dehydratase [Xanthomonas sacchari]|uniref:class II aldolase/adducin family protein n=1 Tax=Xanthomonas sacchari TaxID=56458 RepID=UPI002257BDD6|nr:class II aldolase/adducin family protein [Xanthomonas sacchari]MCW0394917.1 Methylthioribulose-1-phosphate dehydratase [Xanthomonas sacchari]MCW0444513.1 Methylthioribulose-1-phosphate dehydratase [Xanthomonas sacchari]MCW0465643.1 Methylthioribulose-1-phosphate dehydratase [Xanthomonas sacchari]